MDDEFAGTVVTVAAMKLLLGQLYTLVYTLARLSQLEGVARAKGP